MMTYNWLWCIYWLFRHYLHPWAYKKIENYVMLRQFWCKSKSGIRTILASPKGVLVGGFHCTMQTSEPWLDWDMYSRKRFHAYTKLCTSSITKHTGPLTDRQWETMYSYPRNYVPRILKIRCRVLSKPCTLYPRNHALPQKNWQIY